MIKSMHFVMCEIKENKKKIKEIQSNELIIVPALISILIF